MTAADLCAELSISSGAVSTAIKHLMPVGLSNGYPHRAAAATTTVSEPEPGRR
ncbi:hypothetical protein [Nocardia donostiensis]|uniref:hypothetical protein n=1 Tax=Nocardia donostiensis TaxID=1538463 RepID=UPI00158EE94C|nr:hypothetical protein [Nocardia donostiensis]